MTLFNAVADHISGANHAPGFYVFHCSKCKHQWAMPATDSRIWPINEDVSDARWVNPSMPCSKCDERVTSGDNMWAEDPIACRENKIRQWVASKTAYVGGLFAKSYAIAPEGVVTLHVRSRTYEVREKDHKYMMTNYIYMGNDSKFYTPILAMPVTVLREDGVFCAHTVSMETAARCSVDYTETVEWFRSGECSDNRDAYKPVEIKE